MSFKRPDEIADLALYRVCLPDSAEWRTQLWGAISLLLQEWQWEGESPLSDDVIAAQYLAVINSFERLTMIPGLVVPYAGETLPAGYLWCRGVTYDKNDYPELFAVIGYTYGGSGDNFDVPDLRERFPYGRKSPASLGDLGGSKTETLTVGQIPAHHHTQWEQNWLVGVTPGEVVFQAGTIYTDPTGDTGGGNSHNNQPPYIVLNYLISTGQDGC